MSDTEGFVGGAPVPTARTESDVALSEPAVLVNKAYITVTPIGLRIAFTEQHQPDIAPKVRAAVFMAYSDVLGLRDLLSYVLENTEEAKTEPDPTAEPTAAPVSGKGA